MAAGSFVCTPPALRRSRKHMSRVRVAHWGRGRSTEEPSLSKMSLGQKEEYREAFP